MVALALVVGTGGARADEIVPPQSPRVIEWLAVDISGYPLSFSYWFGGHTWLRNRYLVGLRAAGKVSSLERDLNGDGTIDFSRTLDNNPMHIEVQADLGIPIRSTRGVAEFGSGMRIVERDAAGAETVRWTHVTRVQTERELSIMTGTRVALGGDDCAGRAHRGRSLLSRVGGGVV